MPLILLSRKCLPSSGMVDGWQGDEGQTRIPSPGHRTYLGRTIQGPESIPNPFERSLRPSQGQDAVLAERVSHRERGTGLYIRNRSELWDSEVLCPVCPYTLLYNSMRIAVAITLLARPRWIEVIDSSHSHSNQFQSPTYRMTFSSKPGCMVSLPLA